MYAVYIFSEFLYFAFKIQNAVFSYDLKDCGRIKDNNSFYFKKNFNWYNKSKKLILVKIMSWFKYYFTYIIKDYFIIQVKTSFWYYLYTIDQDYINVIYG